MNQSKAESGKTNVTNKYLNILQFMKAISDESMKEERSMNALSESRMHITERHSAL